MHELPALDVEAEVVHELAVAGDRLGPHPGRPWMTSAGTSSGMKRWQAATNARLEKSRYTSASPVRQYLRAIRLNPG